MMKKREANKYPLKNSEETNKQTNKFKVVYSVWLFIFTPFYNDYFLKKRIKNIFQT